MEAGTEICLNVLCRKRRSSPEICMFLLDTKTNCVNPMSTGLNHRLLPYTERFDPNPGGITRKGGVPFFIITGRSKLHRKILFESLRILSQKKGVTKTPFLSFLFLVLFPPYKFPVSSFIAKYYYLNIYSILSYTGTDLVQIPGHDVVAKEVSQVRIKGKDIHSNIPVYLL